MDIVKTFAQMERGKLTNLLILFLCALFFWISITTLLPTLPAYLQDIGATAKQIGFIMGCFAIGLLLSRVWLGKLADEGLSHFLKSTSSSDDLVAKIICFCQGIFGQLIHYPSRKIVILIGTFVAATAPIGYFLLHSLPELMVIRAYHGISIAAFTTGYSALVVDLSPPKQKGELIGYMSLAIPIGMAIGPAVGGYLQAYTGYPILFLICVGCGLLSFTFACNIRELRCLQAKQDNLVQGIDTAKNPGNNSRTFAQLIFNPSFLIPAIVLLLIGCLFGVLVTYLPLYIRELKDILETDVNFNAGLFYAAAAIASFGVRLVSGKASDRYGRGLFISSSLVCYLLSMILLANTSSENIFLVSAILEGAGAGVLVPITLALVSDRCIPTERGKAFAVCISGFDVGVALGGPVFGSFLLDFGYRFLFSCTALMATIALVIFLFFGNQGIINSWKFAIGSSTDLYALKE